MLFIKTITSFLQDEEYRDLLITTAIILTLGSVAYHHLEGWSWVDSLYFSVITLTTIGYGDFSPVTDAGKLFTIFYIIIGIGIILSFIDTIHSHYNTVKTTESKKYKKNKKEKSA